MKTNKYYLIFVLLFLSTLSFSQNVDFEKKNFPNDKEGYKQASKELKSGDGFYFQGVGFYKEAIPFFERANKFNPNNAELNFKLGNCYLESMHQYKALPFLEKANKLDANLDPTIHYSLGRAYHIDEQFQQALFEFNLYRGKMLNTNNPFVMKGIDLQIKQCHNAIELVKTPIRVFIDNLGENINTKYNEYGAVISADESEMLFTARRPNSTGGKIDPMLNENYEDIYESTRQEDGSWSKAVQLNKPVNTENHDSNSGVSADGQRLLIYYGKKGNGDVYETILEGETWGKPEALSKKINSKDSHESSACYSPDGNAIYFVSDKPGGIGDHDIYITRKDEKGKWGEAINLGSVINTQYNEEGVFMHPDGKTLYFSSEGHNSMGGYDIFKSIYDEETKTWSKPENIGYPVNTPGNDVFFVVSADGRHGYYTSASEDGFGLRDLYVITFLGEEKPMVLNNEDNLLACRIAPVEEVVVAPVVVVKEAQLTILKGVVTDYLSKEVLEAEIEIVDNEANKVIATFKSNSATGKYLVSLPAGKNYGIAVKKEGYLFHSENFDIPKTAAFQTVEKNVELKNLKVGNKIVLRNIFFDTDKATLRPESTAELNRLIKLMNDVPTLKIELGGHTDSQGANAYNQSLSERRAKAVVDYLTKNGISAARLVSKGYGEEEPVSTNETAEGRQENRRTEFKILAL